jgi:hypothetical protein
MRIPNFRHLDAYAGYGLVLGPAYGDMGQEGQQ